MGVKISASLMCADLNRLGQQVEELAAAGVDWLHFDIMDGHFVPNFALGACTMEAVRPTTDLLFDVHLMVQDPEPHVAAFVEAGADLLVVHAEACPDLGRTLGKIRDAGVMAGLALNPGTPFDSVRQYADQAQMILVMGVQPGFAGQKLAPRTNEAIAAVRRGLDELGAQAELQVDGNVSFEHAGGMVAAGATVLVAGSSSVFSREVGSIAEGVRRLREAAAQGEKRGAAAG
ncbi:MAG: ribulose-phosphate 3-epimerase [Armatimonadota bacterium]